LFGINKLDNDKKNRQISLARAKGLKQTFHGKL